MAGRPLKLAVEAGIFRNAVVLRTSLRLKVLS